MPTTTHRVTWHFSVRLLDVPPELDPDWEGLLLDMATQQAVGGNNWGELRLVQVSRNTVEVWDRDSEYTDPGDPRVIATVRFEASDPVVKVQ